jgi:hypothetical protein
LALVRALTRDRAHLALENLVLRQPLAVLRRSVKRARLDDSDRLLMLHDKLEGYEQYACETPYRLVPGIW